MRLGYHYHTPAHRLPNGRIVTISTEGRFLDCLASHCDRLVCFLHEPRDDEWGQLNYEMQSPNLHWVSLGTRASTPKRTLLGRGMMRPVADWRDRLDALLVRGPSPLLPAAARSSAGALPLALLLVGDYEAIVDDLPQPAWRREAIRCWARWNRRQQEAVARSALTMVNSEELRARLEGRLPHIVGVRTTNLRESDFFARADTCERSTCRLLYAGRMDRGKGLLVLVEAVAALVASGDNVVLDLVGPVQAGDPILDETKRLAAERGVADRVTYHGSQPVGPKLFAFHRRSDIFVHAALSTEGFPRAIWEAQANSLPVVASRVGGIPFALRDGETARLVEPRSTTALASTIGEIIHDRALRTRLISNGLKLASDNTLEKRTLEMIRLLKDWIRDPASRIQ